MRIAVFCDVYPELSETFVVNEIRAMRREGHEVRVVSVGRAEREHWPGDLDIPVAILDDIPRSRKARAAVRLLLTRPRAAVRDRSDRSAWRPAERPRRLAALAPVVNELAEWGTEHIHVHFAAGAAMEGLRIGAVLDIPVSVTAHAYEIFRSPRNLRRKLERASFTTTGCAYNVAHLRGLVEPPVDERIHAIVMGVDATAFQRTRPHATGGRVVAIGRLTEKKGFGDLVRACSRLRDHPAFARLTIVGEGPLERELRGLVETLGLTDVVDLAGARTPEEIRELLEDAAVLCMPCVVAPDGDRDSMPVVVKEALAMEVPVVATDEVGLPEIVDAACGRLVPPGAPDALAAALGEVLALPPGERAALGRAGRRRVLERCDVGVETRRLLALIETSAHP